MAVSTRLKREFVWRYIRYHEAPMFGDEKPTITKLVQMVPQSILLQMQHDGLILIDHEADLIHPALPVDFIDGYTLRGEVLIRDGRRCSYCGRLSDPTKVHVDHRIPRSRGGVDSYDNLCVACETCNLRKYDMTPEEFAWKFRFAPLEVS